MTDSNATRQARFRESRAKQGYKAPSILLTPAALASLKRWKAAGWSMARALNFLAEAHDPPSADS